MKRLSKDQKQQRADLVTRLNDAAEAVRAALAAVNAEITGKLNSAIENYNLVVSVVEAFRDEIVGEMEHYASDHSDRWQKNDPAPSRLVNADALGEALKFYPRRPRLKPYGAARPGTTFRNAHPRSVPGLGCVKTPTLAARVETSRRNCIPESQTILHTRGVMLSWRIVFSTFRDCMSFDTWGDSGSGARVATKKRPLMSAKWDDPSVLRPRQQERLARGRQRRGARHVAQAHYGIAVLAGLRQ